MKRRRASRLLPVVIVFGVLALPAAAGPPHNHEIQAYATNAAMAQTASGRCAEILVNHDLLGKAPAFFHMMPDDRQAYQIEIKRLAATLDGAPSAKAWCDEAYRAYGPEGDAAKGLPGK